MSLNPINIAKLIKESFPNFKESEVTDVERRLAELFIEKIQSGASEDEIDQEGLAFYECDPYEDEAEYESDTEEEVEEEANRERQKDPDWEEESGESPERKKRRSIPKEEVEKALKYYRSAMKGTRSVNSMNQKFRWIKTRDDITNHLLK